MGFRRVAFCCALAVAAAVYAQWSAVSGHVWVLQLEDAALTHFWAVSAAGAFAVVVAVVALHGLQRERRRHGDRVVFAGSAQTPERLKVFAKWAQQQIEESKPEAHRQILDDVICTFATYAQRLDQDPSQLVRDAAVHRLRVLIELLETPRVQTALRDVNWAWLREWDRKTLDPREARIRCMTVFPTICAAFRAKLILEVRFRGYCGRRSPVFSGYQLASPSSLGYLAAWCADFLERADVLTSLGFSAERQLSTASGVCFLSPGALYSDSEEENDDTPLAANADAWLDAANSASHDGLYKDYVRQTHEGQEHCWSEPDATQALVRGPHYLVDRHKDRSLPAMLQLVEVDLIKTHNEIEHYSASSRGMVVKMRRNGEKRFLFVLNFRLTPIQLACVWAMDKDVDWQAKPEGRLFEKYRRMSPEERNARLKVLPKVVEGPWIVKKVMPDRPGVVGKKLKTDYYISEDYMEVSMNCISSSAGRRIASICTGAGTGKQFKLEIFIILESQANDELPERVLGGLSINYGDLNALRPR